MLYLNTDHLARCRQTLASSLLFYQQAQSGSIEQEVFRNALVKGYELAQETTFKLLKKALKEYGYSAKKLESMPVKEILRLAAIHDLMTLEEVERWFTAHDYGQAFAEQPLVLIPDFLRDVARLTEVLDTKLGYQAHD